MSLNQTNKSYLKLENHSIQENEICEKHEFTGGVVTLMFLLSMIFNIFLLGLMCRSGEMKETRNLYLIGLLALNVINGSIDLPLFILRDFHCK